MTRLIISTCTRGAPPGMASGHLYVVDLEKLNLLHKAVGIEPPYRQFDPNPRGGMRGLKGISLYQDELVLANYSALFVFDCNWNLLRTITHPSVSSIHEIYYAQNGIWVTSAANDLLVRFDRDGNLQELDYIRSHENLMWRIRGPLRQILNRTDILRGKIDFRQRNEYGTDVFDRTHMNGVEILTDGRILISLGRVVGDLYILLVGLKTLMQRLGIWKLFLAVNRGLRSILALKKKMLSELVAQPVLGTSLILIGDPKKGWRSHLQFQVTQNPSHSPRLMADGSGLYLDSSHGRLVHFDKKGNILSNPVISDKFLRGLLILPNGQLAIGAGNTLLIYDLMRNETVGELQLTDDASVSIFDIKVLPEHFDLPPESLEAKCGRILGFDGPKIIWGQDS